MKENKYNNEEFFNEYKKMACSIKGLEGAGEWHELKKMLPNFKDKNVLDLGCGFGWHCRYAVENEASHVIGIDISEKMRPVDKYFEEGTRKANFLGEEVIKYHKTLTTYINNLIMSGFEITKVVEPEPEKEMLENNLEMQEELRRPMMLLISARKK